MKPSARMYIDNYFPIGSRHYIGETLDSARKMKEHFPKCVSKLFNAIKGNAGL